MNLASTLDAVTVYQKGAVCTRKAVVAAGAPAQVRITGLPLSLQPGSLRARVVSGGPARVLDVRPGYDVELAAEADVPTEQKAVEAATEQLARLQLDLARVERDIAELKKLEPRFPALRPGDPPRSAPVEALLKAAEFVSQELAGRFETRRALAQELEDAKNELELRRRRLAEASAKVRTERARLSRVAVVTLAEAAAGAELAVEYFVPGARWVPSYALRLDRGMAQGALSMRAAVAQDTGEDWAGVKLSLSTAALDRRTALPELKSLRIGREQPPPARSGWREPPPGLDELFQGFDAEWAKRPKAPPPPPPPPKQPAPVVRSPGPRREPASKTLVAEAAANVAIAGAGPPPGAPRLEQQATGMIAPMAPQSSRSRATAAPMARMAPKKKGGFLPSFGGGGGDSDEQEEAAPAAELSLDDGLDMEGGDPFQGMPEPPAPQLEPAAELLDYGTLFMQPAGLGRGRLAPGTDPGVAYLMAMHVEVHVVTSVVMAVAQRALRIEHLALPARTQAPAGGAFDYRYDCAARVDVPSKPEWTLVPVSEADVGLVAEYACVPSVEPQVYRTLKLHNRSKHALLKGPVDVTLGDEFLLTAELPYVAPGSSDARLGLGVEEAIKVARKTHFKEGTGGLLGGSTVLPHDVEIEVNNRLAFPARIEVRERVPVSLDDDVKIEEAKVEPAWEKDEELRDGAKVRGARAWRVTVPAGQKTKLTAQWVVRIPSDQMLVGGNRRV